MTGAATSARGNLGLACHSARHNNRAVAEGHTVPAVAASDVQKGNVSSRRNSVPSLVMALWRRRGRDTAVAPQLQTIDGAERRHMVPSPESPGTGGGKSTAPLIGAETHPRVETWRDNKHLDAGGRKEGEDGEKAEELSLIHI